MRGAFLDSRGIPEVSTNEILLTRFRTEPQTADDSIRIEPHGNRHSAMIEDVERVDREGPFKFPPLTVKPSTIGVLFLNDTDRDDASGRDVRSEFLLPPGQNSSAACSP